MKKKDKNKIEFSLDLPSEEEMKRIKDQRFKRARQNPNCISNWLPLVQTLKINIPKTELIEVSLEKYEEEMFLVFDGKQSDSKLLDDLQKKMEDKTKGFTFPVFMKTGTFSAKHSWKRTCLVEKKEDLLNHLLSIIYEQHCVGASSSHFVALREMIKTETDLFSFEQMPVTKERRYFYQQGKVVAHHPYWPPNSIKDYQKDENWEEKLEKINKESREEVLFLKEKTLEVGKKLESLYPNWSIDWLQDTEGNWYLIDVAVLEQSFMWKDYPHLKKHLD